MPSPYSQLQGEENVMCQYKIGDRGRLYTLLYVEYALASGRVLDVVALSSEDFKIWLNGLQLLLNLGSATVTKVYIYYVGASHIKSTHCYTI